jgi:RNA polymerase sigma factor (sigma-70 family)
MRFQVSTTNSYDDNFLWSAIRNDNDKLFSMLFEKYYNDLIRYGNSLSSHTDKVQDCVQDVFADVWLYRHSLPESVVVKAYLLSSIRKRIARQYDRDRIFRKIAGTDSIDFLFDFSVEHHLINDESTAESVLYLNKLLNDLPPRQKEALYLRYSQGLSVNQIAAVLQLNYQSASNLLHRALLTLRREWKGTISLIAIISLLPF